MRTYMKHVLVLSLLVLLAAATACNRPVSTPPPESGEKSLPEPEMTLTALFALLETAQAEQSANVPTAIILPSSTPATQPTQTQALVETLPVQAQPGTSAVAPTALPVAAATTEPTIEPTAAPTKAAVTYKGPGVRSGASIVANYLQREPTIDGVFDEWDLDRYQVDNLVFGGNRWSGVDDCSGSVMMGWDDYYLYIAARVRDDAFVQTSRDVLLYRGDSIEILLDVNVSADFRQAELSKDDFQIGFSPGNFGSEGPETYLWYPKSMAGSYIEIKLAATQTDNGYRLEAKIPWSLLGIKPDIGQHYGLAFSISDNDRAAEKVQQSMVSNVAGRELTNPTTWGDLTLAGRK